MSESRSWYEIKPAENAAAASDVYLYGPIGEFGVSAGMFLEALGGVKSKAINLHINSPGGHVDAGVAIYTALKDHPATVNGIAEGMCASIATIVLQAADTRNVAAGTLLMIHEGRVGLDAIVRGNATTMRSLAAEAEKQAVYLDKIDASMAEIYAARGGGSESDWRGMMAAETWFRPREAVDAGLADAVIPAKGATNHAETYNLAELGFQNVPDWAVQSLKEPEIPSQAPISPLSRAEARRWPLLPHHTDSGALDIGRLAIALRRAYDLNIPIDQREAAIRHLKAHEAA